MNTNQLIIVKGEDQTSEVVKWNYDYAKGVVYIVYLNGKEYPYKINDIKIYKDPVNVSVSGKCVYVHEIIKYHVETAQFFGYYCRLIYQNGHTELFLKKYVKIVESALDDQISENCFKYLKEIVGLYDENRRNILAAHYDKIQFVSKESALASFLSGTHNKNKIVGQKNRLYTHLVSISVSQKQ